MAMTLISTNTDTPGSVTDSAFTSCIDSTYKLYIFKFIDVNPATDGQNLMVNFSTDGGSNYDLTITSTYHQTTHYENDSDAYGPSYNTDGDIANDGNDQMLVSGIGNGVDESCAGTLWLFNPSNTTYVKHFYSRIQEYCYPNISRECYAAGYVNAASSDIDAVVFRMSSGDFTGTIKMYGVG